jgi:hypothetical protein
MNNDQLLIADGDYDFYKPPKYVGGWVIGGNWTMNVLEKPTDEQIKNTEQLLGWKWVDQ